MSAIEPSTVAALVVAAGRGLRARALGTAAAQPKQYVCIGGQPILARTLMALAAHPTIDQLQVVIHPDDHDLYSSVVAALPAPTRDRLLPSVDGGATRQASVLAGLQALAGLAPRYVLIHDAARPFVDAAIIGRVLAALETSAAVVAGAPVTDTLKRADTDGIIVGTVPREGLWRAQTPQGFHYPAIVGAHRAAAAAGRHDFTDDAAIVEWAGSPVRLVEGGAGNIKLTTPEDFVMAEQRVAGNNGEREYRTGQGFDVHRFCDGDHVWLGGIQIPHERALDGHSDADVALHALTDALLGTIGDGDIGQHFPPSDPQWRGAASHLFLADAARRVRERNGRIVNVDLTLLCEAPRIGPHRVAMQTRIAEILAVSPDRVGVKATTTEQLGFTGRREGIAAMAIATVSLPRD